MAGDDRLETLARERGPGRARRNRPVRGAVTAVAAALATTGVVLAGVAVAGLRHDDDQVADQGIADQWDVDYSACGLSLDELGWLSQAEGPVILAMTSSGDGTDWNARSDAAGNLTVTTVLASSATDARLTLVAPRPDFVIQSAGGGVVVGVLGTPAGQEPDDGLVPPTTTPHLTAAPMYSCAAADGRPALEAGDYVLAGSQQAVLEDPDGTEREYLALSQQRLEVPTRYVFLQLRLQGAQVERLVSSRPKSYRLRCLHSTLSMRNENT